MKGISSKISKTSSEVIIITRTPAPPIVVEPILIKVDNQGAMNIATCTVMYSRSKRIVIKSHHIRDLRQYAITKRQTIYMSFITPLVHRLGTNTVDLLDIGTQINDTTYEINRSEKNIPTKTDAIITALKCTTKELLDQFRATDSNYDIISEIVGRKQQSTESLDNYCTAIHVLVSRMRSKIPQLELIRILQINVKTSLANLIFAVKANNMKELKTECRKPEKQKKKNRQKFNDRTRLFEELACGVIPSDDSEKFASGYVSVFTCVAHGNS
uniref:Uncharacterized protein n=1 Tax=Glossina pallidipes TaxID=7398 RepID=A0A1A9Z1X8_GLOPL